MTIEHPTTTPSGWVNFSFKISTVETEKTCFSREIGPFSLFAYLSLTVPTRAVLARCQWRHSKHDVVYARRPCIDHRSTITRPVVIWRQIWHWKRQFSLDFIPLRAHAAISTRVVVAIWHWKCIILNDFFIQIYDWSWIWMNFSFRFRFWQMDRWRFISNNFWH